MEKKMKPITKNQEPIVDKNDDLTSVVSKILAEDVSEAKRVEADDLKVISEVAAALDGIPMGGDDEEGIEGAEGGEGEAGLEFPDLDFGGEAGPDAGAEPPVEAPAGEGVPPVPGAEGEVEEEKAISLSMSALNKLLTCVGEKAKGEWSEAEVTELVDKFINQFGGVGDLSVITPEDVETVCAEEAAEEGAEGPAEEAAEAGGPPAAEPPAAEAAEEEGEEEEKGEGSECAKGAAEKPAPKAAPAKSAPAKPAAKPAPKAAPAKAEAKK